MGLGSGLSDLSASATEKGGGTTTRSIKAIMGSFICNLWQRQRLRLSLEKGSVLSACVCVCACQLKAKPKDNKMILGKVKLIDSCRVASGTIYPTHI